MGRKYMQVPRRKPGKYTHEKPDPHLTKEKFNEMKDKLANLKKILPAAAAEVKRLSEMGDFSENAAYQMAKGRLRGINDNILQIQEHLKHAVIITPDKNTDTLRIGHCVTIDIAGKQTTYLILGSSEVDPAKGIISHNSPLGSVLIGHKVGDTVILKLKGREVECKIIKIGVDYWTIKDP